MTNVAVLTPEGWTGSNGVPELVRAVWHSDPAVVGRVGGRWRWQAGPENLRAIRELLARRIGPGMIELDPPRATSVRLEANRPSDRPCEVLLYPSLLTGSPEGHEAPVYLGLFYAVSSPGRPPTEPERERAYFRVVQTLDRWDDALSQLYPGREVRAIDLPMPGWMLQTLRPTDQNSCALVHG